MTKCSCYEERKRCVYDYPSYPPTFKTYGICLGTRECEECLCGGDESKCDFYPEKRKEAKKSMNTAQMWLAAQEDGKTYECTNGDIAYSKRTGLVDKNNFNHTWALSNWDYDGAAALDKLLGECEWVEMKIMTKAEAEEKLGVHIVD